MSEVITEKFYIPIEGRNETLGITWAAVSRPRLDRMSNEPNEDSIIANNDSGLFIVLDGLGQHADPARASSESGSCIETETLKHTPYPTKEAALNGLKNAFIQAHERLYDLDLDHTKKEGSLQQSQTTASAVLFWQDPATNKKYALIAHVGDSRVYRRRKGNLECITIDHDMGFQFLMGGRYEKLLPLLKSKQELISNAETDAEIAEVNKPIKIDSLSMSISIVLWNLRHVVSNSIGGGFSQKSKGVHVETHCIEAEPGDEYLIVSDGVSDSLTTKKITQELESASSPSESIQKILDAVDEVNSSGSKRSKEDDVSIILIRAD